MVCYEVITRQEVYQDAEANADLIIKLIETRGQKPNLEKVELVRQKLQVPCREVSLDLKIFEHINIIMEKCWKFKSENRPTMIQSKKS